MKDFNVVEVIKGIQQRLQNNKTITGVVLEVTTPLDSTHSVRVNIGTYKELAETFEGTSDELSVLLTKDIESAITEAIKALNTLQKDASSDDTGKNPLTGEKNTTTEV